MSKDVKPTRPAFIDDEIEDILRQQFRMFLTEDVARVKNTGIQKRKKNNAQEPKGVKEFKAAMESPEGLTYTKWLISEIKNEIKAEKDIAANSIGNAASLARQHCQKITQV